MREKVWEMLGGRPERTPLEPVVVRTVQRRGYRVENVMFQSRPNFWVTGNLYIPEGRGPFPAVLSPCGHYPWRRMYPDYQFVYMGLVRAGFVVLGLRPDRPGRTAPVLDPRDRPGNRRFDLRALDARTGTAADGRELTQYRVWDGIAAIDYLLTRPEVDRDKIGCAGHSAAAR